MQSSSLIVDWERTVHSVGARTLQHAQAVNKRQRERRQAPRRRAAMRTPVSVRGPATFSRAGEQTSFASAAVDKKSQKTAPLLPRLNGKDLTTLLSHPDTKVQKTLSRRGRLKGQESDAVAAALSTRSTAALARNSRPHPGRSADCEHREPGHEAFARRLLGEIASHRDPPDEETGAT
jgi:hypothetical protein